MPRLARSITAWPTQLEHPSIFEPFTSSSSAEALAEKVRNQCSLMLNHRLFCSETRKRRKLHKSRKSTSWMLLGKPISWLG